MSHSKIIVAASLSLLLAVSCNVDAQTQPADSNSLKPGAWAFQFGITSNFTLTSFQGTTLALAYHTSDHSALRAGITLSGNLTDGTDLQNSVQGDTNQHQASGDNTSHSVNVTAILQQIWYANPQDVIHMYFGVGPSISYSYSKTTRLQNALTSEQTFYSTGYYWTQLNSSSSTTQVGIGARGVAGLEWFPVRWFSIRAEYSEGIQYQWTTNKTTAQGTTSAPSIASTSVSDKGSSKGWALNAYGVSFGASIYF